MTMILDETVAGSFPDQLGEIGAIMVLIRDDWRTDGTYDVAFDNLENVIDGDFSVSGDIQKARDIAQYVRSIFQYGQECAQQINQRLRWVAKELNKRHVNIDTGQFDEGGLAGSGSGSGVNRPTSDFNNAGPSQPVMQYVTQELWRQMYDPPGTAPSITVKKCTTTAAATAGDLNTGNGLVVMSVKRGDGLNNPHVMGATGRIRCTISGFDNDQYRYREGFEYIEAGGPGPAHPDWAEGTRGYGTKWQFTGCDPTAWNERGQLLANPFASFTDNKPDRWDVVTGTAGVDFRESTTVTYFSEVDKVLELVAGTATNAELKQSFNSDAGAEWFPEGNTPVVTLVRLRAAGTISAGILVMKWTDSAGATLTDDQGAALSKEVTLSAVASGSWSDHYDQWNLPRNVPPDSQFHIGIKASNLLTGANLYLTSPVITKMQRPYKGAWYITHIAGNVPAASAVRANLGDYWNIAATNDNGGRAHPTLTYQRLAARTLDTPQYEIALPETSGTADWEDTTGIA